MKGNPNTKASIHTTQEFVVSGIIDLCVGRGKEVGLDTNKLLPVEMAPSCKK